MLEINLQRKLKEREKDRKSISFMKRASVAIILKSSKESLVDVKILYIRRPGQDEKMKKLDRWAGHVAFPGGKKEVHESDMDTAIRETREEIGWNLKDQSLFAYIGQLDDREVKAPASSKTIMVLCSFVYLLKDSKLPIFDLSAGEVYGIYMIPISYLISSATVWEPVRFDISHHLFPNLPSHSLTKSILRYFLGGINFYGIPALDEFLVASVDQDCQAQIPKPAKVYPLWGLSLWITSDFLCINSTTFPIADKGAPQYTSWDIEMLMNFFHLLKPKKLERYLLRSYLPIGFRTSFAIKYAAVLAVCLRIAIIYFLLFRLFPLIILKNEI